MNMKTPSFKKVIPDSELCPVCKGDENGGPYTNEDGECKFCDGYGFLILTDKENDPERTNGWDKLEYTHYLTYLRQERRYFKHSTNQIVIEGGGSFFDEPAKPNTYIKV